MRIVRIASPIAALLGLSLVAAVGCSKQSPPVARGRDAVPLEADSRVYRLVQEGRCAEAASILDAIPRAQHDVQWFMRRGDIHLCVYRQVRTDPARAAVVSHFEAGIRRFPDSSRLMLEFGVAYTAWDDLSTAKQWWRKAQALASQRLAADLPAYGLDHESSVKQQAADLLRIAEGG